MDLLALQPHKVSRDLSGYISYLYGAPKTGKTTLAVQAPDPILLAFERGYNALPGVIAQDITSWSEMRQVYRELKKPEIKERFKTVIVDTIDIACDMCQKYICNQKDIESLGDLGYGKGWMAFKAEFNDVFRGLTQLGYAVIFLGHDKEVTDDNGNVTAIKPALTNSTRAVIEGMADVYGYAHQKNPGEMSVLTLRDSSGKIACGGRFKYMAEEISTNYESLSNALISAIDKEAAEHDNKFVTDDKMDIPQPSKEYNFEAMMAEFQSLVGDLMTKDQSNARRITPIIEKYLGKNRKVSEISPTQSEQLELIILDIKELSNKPD